ncbi:MAG: PilN domain-containing protein [Rhodobacterales bacterium]|nr:PilN domain-containing protein [Rhodobacterales bacterium]
MALRANSMGDGGGGGLGGFLSWWRGELAGMVGAAPRGAARPAKRLVISLHGDQAEIRLITRRGARAQSRALGGFQMAGGDQGDRRAAAALLARHKRLPLGLHLPDMRALRKDMRFPVAAEAHLRDVLATRMDRVTPYAAGQVYFDHVVVGRDPAARELSVRLLALPRAGVDAIMQRLADLGAQPRYIEIDGAESDGGGDETGDEDGRDLIDLHHQTGQAAPARTWTGLHTGLALVNLVLVAGLVAFPLWQRAETERQLTEEVAAAKLKADAVIKLRDRVDRLTEEASFLARRKQAVPVTVLILDEVTRRLPDDTWLEQMSIRNGEMTLYGNSPRASGILAEMEASDRFANVRFRAPVTRGATPQTERFHISADLEPGGDG